MLERKIQVRRVDKSKPHKMAFSESGKDLYILNWSGRVFNKDVFSYKTKTYKSLALKFISFSSFATSNGGHHGITTKTNIVDST